MLINEHYKAYRLRNFPVYNILRQKVKQEIIKAKQFWTEKNIKSAKSFWKIVNDITDRNNKVSVCSLLSSTNYTSYEDLANAINVSFTDNFQTSSNFPEIMPANDWKVPICDLDIMTQIDGIDSRKSSPHTDLPIRLYNAISVIISAPLCHIFRESISKKLVPDVWKIAQVHPLPKSNTISMDKLRPISLLPTASKIMERIVINSIQEEILKNNDVTQYAYKPSSSTNCALIDMVHFITSNLDKPDCAAVALVAIDFSKAFDIIDHGILLRKISKILPSDCILWLQNYLSNRKQRVFINRFQSEISNVTSGVPQGSIIGPLLFSLFISDLIPSNSKSKMVKYADDIKLLVCISKEERDSDLIILKNEIANIFKWSAGNKMKLNTKKTKLMFFLKNSCTDCILPSEMYGIQAVSTLKLLGVTFDVKLDFKEHFIDILKRASQRLYFLRILKKHFGKDKLWYIFFTLIRSLLEYAAPLFMCLPKSVDEWLEKLQRRAHRIICGLSWTNDGDHCDCVIIKLKDRRIDLGMRLFDKIRRNFSHPLYKVFSGYTGSNITRGKSNYCLPHINSNLFKCSFFNYCIITKLGLE